MKSTQNLWILFSLQALTLAMLFCSYLWMQARVDHLQEANQAAVAKWPLLQQRLETESPDAARRDAQGLAILSAKGTKTIAQMEDSFAQALGFICIPPFVFTTWLGILAVKMRGPSRTRTAARFPPA